MRKQVIDRDILLDKAYKIAEAEGLSALSARKLADACGVSVGAAYRYYPSKDDLTTAVIERFFVEAFHGDFCNPKPGEDYIAFCRRLLSDMREALSRFRADWLSEIRRLGDSGISAGKSRERFYLQHMEKGLEVVFENDPSIDHENLPDGIDAGSVSRFVLDNLLEAVRSPEDTTGADDDGVPGDLEMPGDSETLGDSRTSNDDDCEVLFTLLSCALHGGAANGRKVAVRL